MLAPLLLCAALARATSPPEEVDHVALAALLIRDGHWDRASDALARVDTERSGVDLSRYHLLRGLVLLREERFAQAALALQAALDAGHADPGLRLPLARALLGDGRPTEALTALEPVEDRAEAWRLRARAHEDLADSRAAYAALQQGVARFPEEEELGLERILFLVRHGLYQAAREEGIAWVAGRKVRVEASLAIAEALRRSGEHDQALELLEDARLRHPERVEVHTQLAGTWLDAGHPLACGQILQVATELDPELAVQAAECFRLAGRIDRALYLNQRAVDPVDKARQRLGLLVEREDFDQAIALRPRLERLGLLDEDPVAYALAYSAYAVGDLDTAETLIQGIHEPSIFRSATQLRTAMLACREEPWTCR